MSIKKGIEMSTTREGRLLRSARDGLQSALNILDGYTHEDVEVNMVRNSANQASQAAAELNLLCGMLDVARTKIPQKKWFVFTEGTIHTVSGRGLVCAVKNPIDSKNTGHLFNKIVEINDKLYYVTGVEYQRPFDNVFKKGMDIALQVREAKPKEILHFLYGE